MGYVRVKVLGKAASLLKLLADNPGATVPSLAVLLGEPRPEDVTVGIASVGAPIFDHNGGVHAAISVGGLRSAVLGDGAGERAVRLVTEGAAEISRKMGFRS